ncbi:MAG: hypothetical protein GH150_06005 [Hadesarchaea archaeon]|nr:hypothetical protein [Hadesarchaea archaeon]
MRRESLSEIINRMVVDFKGIRTPEAIEFAKKYFSKARADLKGAKVLHKKKVFDDSVLAPTKRRKSSERTLHTLFQRIQKENKEDRP